MLKEVQLQRDYYTRTAGHYDKMHAHGGGEHDLACALISSLAAHHNLASVLDVGSGTGRAVATLSRNMPHARIIGVEPVEALRGIGHSKGILNDQLIDGDATNLNFENSSIDLVIELGVLHHLRDPRVAVSEMLRVARRAIFISDSNRFGQGGQLAKYAKLGLWKLGLWPLANWVKTKGRGYNYGEGDGVAYSYSVFDDYDFIQKHCSQIMVFNLDGSGKRALTGAPHVGLFALKNKTSA